MAVNSLTVFLINTNEVERYSELVVDDCRRSKLDIDDGTLFYRIKKDENYPSWVDNFFGQAKLGENRKKFKTKTVAAVYFTSINWNRQRVIFAIAFGSGRYLIKQEYIKREFGLDTSRHAIDASRISSMSTITYDSGIKNKTIQSVAEIAQNDFFLNANTDVLAAVKGKTRDDLGSDLLQDRTIGGRDSVSITAKVDVNNIKTFLLALYTQYKSDGAAGVRYESNIRKLATDAAIQQAVRLLETLLQSDQRGEKAFLNLPLEELKEDTVVRGYVINDEDEKSSLTDDVFDRYHTVQLLQQTYVRVNFEDENKPALVKPLYQFVYAEIENDDDCIILAGGQFYKVVKRYKRAVDTFYDEVEVGTILNLGQWNGEDEGTFNSNQTAENILVMDKELVYPEGVDKFEFCDLLTSEKQIVHAKVFGSASQPLGHLFNQGLVSARCMTDETIRVKINEKIREKQQELAKARDFSIPQNVNLSDYKVTFLILCKDHDRIDANGRPKIPFLAKAVFKENITAIRNMGYYVTIVAL